MLIFMLYFGCKGENEANSANNPRHAIVPGISIFMEHLGEVQLNFQDIHQNVKYWIALIYGGNNGSLIAV